MDKFSEEIVKMRSLMERVEKPHTKYQAELNESAYLTEAHERSVKNPSEIFDILDQIGNNKFVSIGTVTNAKLKLPTTSIKNPKTNRMNKVPDMKAFGKAVGSSEDIAAFVKITSYNLRYTDAKAMGEKYKAWKEAANGIRQNFGLNPIATKEDGGYTQKMDYGKGISVYGGDNEDKKGNFYTAQNTYGARIKSSVYTVNSEGHIIQELTDEQVKPYLAAKRPMDGVAALRKLEKSEEEIEDYIKQMTDLKMQYRNFEGNSILYVVATINGEKIIYINTQLMRNVDGVDIDPQDFVTIAKAKYAESMKEVDDVAEE